jgi:TolA-binding protein
MSSPSNLDSSPEKDGSPFEERLAQFPYEKLVQEVISVWDEVIRIEQELANSRQRTRALELELASMDLEKGDGPSITDLEEQLRVMKMRCGQLEAKLENEKIRRIDGTDNSDSRLEELQKENARLLKVEEEHMILILDMESQIDRLISSLKDS